MRRKIYILFSHLIYRPDSELREELVESRHLDLFNEYDQFADAPEVPESWRPENIPEVEEWDELWEEELNYNNPKINLIESVYKPWTVDESCQMPFADEKGFLMGDWAHHMLHLYEQLDFELPESFSHCPDHLMLELEFMSLLIEEVSRQHQHQFLNQHLDWIDDLLEEAQNEDLAGFYIDLIKWLLEFIRAEKEYLAAKSSTA
ncbi:TorD/DmsD family molecular chaperone [Halarsenatibacter silvermanii]|uniref:Nitrate reductase delta subunit n=1 Tax=Halarsenatibacter silvermanii TaxID=321763 RepID=A0A1G9T757_9FIRM|nr:molecular chaperone TorD family protein [Halarsenatibacter silvermanii]SDM43452.1 Nitrate reductase delta subunit [Halarsenatibacter silvermanii]